MLTSLCSRLPSSCPTRPSPSGRPLASYAAAADVGAPAPSTTVVMSASEPRVLPCRMPCRAGRPARRRACCLADGTELRRHVGCRCAPWLITTNQFQPEQLNLCRSLLLPKGNISWINSKHCSCPQSYVY